MRNTGEEREKERKKEQKRRRKYVRKRDRREGNVKALHASY